MKLNKNNKKSNVQYVFVTILLTLLTFSLYLKFFVLINEGISTESEDLMCRSFVATKDLSGIKLGEFFYELNYKCHKDFIEDKNVENKEEIFQNVAEAQKRCWYRFGEGKYDFMSNLNKDGFWCFECAQLDFSESDVKETYSYLEYIEYLNQTTLMVGDENKSYYNYLNLKYANLEDEQEMYEIKDEIDEVIKSGDKNFQDLGMVFNEQYLYLNDLLKKEINPNEKMYVVYRYDKPSEDYGKKIEDALITGATTTGAVMITPIILGTAAAIACGSAIATGGLLTPLCAIVGGKAITSIVKNTIEVTANTIKIAKKVKRITEFISNSIKYSKKTKSLSRIFTGTTKELKDINKVIAHENPKMFELTEELITKLDNNGIKHADDIVVEISKSQKLSKNIDELFDKHWEILNSNALNKLVAKQEIYLKRVEELKKLQKETLSLEKELGMITDSFKKQEKLNQINLNKGKIMKGTIAVIAGATAGIASTGFNYNDNQYVDVLTAEQYYRLCGSRSFSD